MEYARKLINRFNALTNFEVTNWCITDRPDEISDLANTIKPPFGSGKGWWNKMKVYDSFFEGDAIYLDIDTVLIENFDTEIESALDAIHNKGKRIACVSDAITWKGNKFSSSMMVLQSGDMQDMYDTFASECHSLFDYDGGDQVWTGRNLNENHVFYIDLEYPNVKLNLKFHLGQKIIGQWKFPERSFQLPKDCKIVDCGGRPKPHELKHLEYINKCWHEVES